jgi:hypothetical protein
VDAEKCLRKIMRLLGVVATLLFSLSGERLVSRSYSPNLMKRTGSP